ncbi:MAG: helix-turn-helix domain-containing protein [Pyrinomonadaceae bacterium]
MRKSNTREQINVWRFDGMPDLEFRSGVAVTAPYPRHWHEEYQLCLIQAGGGELFYRGVHHTTPTTSLFIVHPGEVHSNQTFIGCSFRSIYMSPEFVRETISGFKGSSQSLPFFPNPMVFDQEVIALYQLLSDQSPDLERESTLVEMLTKLITRYAQEELSSIPVKQHAAVRKVRDYIIEHYARHISLKELVQLVNLSPFHLTRIFTKEIGMPPHAFQTQVRVARARKLLNSGMSLSSVATTTGFADQSHFIRHFKHLTKITPGQYLNNSKNVQYRNPL